MNLSLQAKNAVFVTLVVLVLSVVSTSLFVSNHKQQIESAFIARGTTLSCLLSRIAAEGIEKEKLDLIQKAAFIIQAEDVTKVRVYSDLWDLLEAYPEATGQQSGAVEEARQHFAGDKAEPGFEPPDDFYVQQDGEHYRFFHKVVYQPFENAQHITIGYVRVDMSTRQMQGAVGEMVGNNVLAALLITVSAIVALNLLISRVIVRPITDIHHSVRMFKEGVVFGIPASAASDEIGDLAREFSEMSRTIKEKENMLIESEKHLASLFERVEHAIFRLDASGRIIKANGKFTELFGDDTAKLCEILMGEKRVRDYVGDGVAKVEHVEERVVGKNGEDLVVLLSLYADVGPAGELRGYDGYLLDITGRRKAEQALKLSEEHYRELFENCHDMIQSVGPDGGFLFVNPAWVKALGYSPDEIKTMVVFDIVPPEHRDGCESAFQRVLSGEPLKNYETTFLARDGRRIAVEGNVSSRFLDGRIVATQGMFRDITERKLLEERLRNMAHYDQLTGLPNRTLFNDRLGHALTAARRESQRLALLYVDLDNFKQVNDRQGHNAGDLLLQQAAQRLGKCVRASDTIARLGGDEFCVILPNIKEARNAELLAGKILEAIRQPFFIREQECRVGISIGISLFPDDGSDYETLIKNADSAMYQAKNSGKNSFWLYSSMQPAPRPAHSS